MTKTKWVVLGVIALVAAGCVEQSHSMSAAQREQLQRYVSKTAATPQHEINANFDDRVTLVGYDISADKVQAGETVSITWYWKVTNSMGTGWKQFTHMVDAAGTSRINKDGIGFIREHYAPADWHAGEYLKDEQQILIPDDWNSPSLTLYLGFWKDDSRMHVKSGPSDGDNRVRGLVIPVTNITPPSQPVAPDEVAKPVVVNKISEAITIDGKLNEAAWASATKTDAFVNTMTGAAGEVPATARMMWDANNLYVAFEVTDHFLVSKFKTHDEHMWEQDTIEIMADPDADAHNYFEIQVAPTGQSFDTRYDTRRQPQPVGDLAWTSHVNAKVALRGNVNDDSEDEGYTVELALPWTAFDAGTPPATAPHNGSVWAINLYVMDTPKEGPQHSAGWTAVHVPDFHAITAFRHIEFVDPAAAHAAPSTAPAVEGSAPTAAEALHGHAEANAPAVPSNPLGHPAGPSKPNKMLHLSPEMQNRISHAVRE